jgi:NADH/NAD ratio-sensing transcriptional regulator Rex
MVLAGYLSIVWPWDFYFNMKKSIRYNHSAPQFLVQDVSKSVEFYTKILDFGIDYLSGSPLNYAVVVRNEVYIHLCHHSVLEYIIGPGCAFISVSGVDDIWENIQDKNVQIISPISNQDFGSGVHFRIFSIFDLDKNVLRIGEKIQSE